MFLEMRREAVDRAAAYVPNITSSSTTNDGTSRRFNPLYACRRDATRVFFPVRLTVQGRSGVRKVFRPCDSPSPRWDRLRLLPETVPRPGERGLFLAMFNEMRDILRGQGDQKGTHGLPELPTDVRNIRRKVSPRSASMKPGSDGESPSAGFPERLPSTTPAPYGKLRTFTPPSLNTGRPRRSGNEEMPPFRGREHLFAAKGGLWDFWRRNLPRMAQSAHYEADGRRMGPFAPPVPPCWANAGMLSRYRFPV